MRYKNLNRARGKAVVVTSKGNLTRREVERLVGKEKARWIYGKLKLSKAEIAAAKKAVKK